MCAAPSFLCLMCYNLPELCASMLPIRTQATDPEATYNVPCLCTGPCSSRRRALGTDNCLDPSALNFNAGATGDGSNCAYNKSGCADTAAINFDPDVTQASRACCHRALAATP